jgi:hypothetical protein
MLDLMDLTNRKPNKEVGRLAHPLNFMGMHSMAKLFIKLK